MFDLLLTGLQIVFTPSTFFLLVAGTVLGVIFGAMPGVSASMAVALALPFAYAMNPVIAIAFLVPYTVHPSQAAESRQFCSVYREHRPVHRPHLTVIRWPREAKQAKLLDFH